MALKTHKNRIEALLDNIGTLLGTGGGTGGATEATLLNVKDDLLHIRDGLLLMQTCSWVGFLESLSSGMIIDHLEIDTSAGTSIISFPYNINCSIGEARDTSVVMIKSAFGKDVVLNETAFFDNDVWMMSLENMPKFYATGGVISEVMAIRILFNSGVNKIEFEKKNEFTTLNGL